MEKDVVTESHVEAATTGYAGHHESMPTHRDVRHIQVQSIALANAVAKDRPDYKSGPHIKMYGMVFLCILNGIMNGYDGSVMSSINAMTPFQDRFKIGTTGELNGATFSIYTVGNILGSLLVGYVMDRWGRRAGMFCGSTFIVVGSILQAASFHLPQFFIGRFITGLGTPMCATAAPVFIVEMAYPTWRGLACGLYNACGWYIGSNIASWSAYGTNSIDNDWSWRAPYIIQAAPALLVIGVVWLLPESPRWLWYKNRREQAAATLTKYHGDSNPDSAIVRLEIEEIKTSLEMEEELKNRNWNYKVLVNTRQARYRMWIIMLIAVFSQFIGGSVISYYFPVMVAGIGITSTNTQLLLNGINTILGFTSAVCGSFFVDKIGRRPLLLWGTFLTGLTYIPITVLAYKASKSNGTIPTGQGYAFIAMIYTYGIFWSFCWTPLQALYPAEILNNEIRAKGMAAQGFIAGVASFINTFGTSVALNRLGWKTYVIFLILHFIHLGLMWLVIVETKNRTLEELEEIFNDPKPVKRSKQSARVVVGDGIGAKLDEDA